MHVLALEIELRPIIDGLRNRFVWSFPEVEVLETWQRWLEED